jgi:hypothetical protein
MMTSTGALAKASVAQRPPKPEPMITTRCLLDPRSVGDRLAELCEVSTVIVYSLLSPAWPFLLAAVHQTVETREPRFNPASAQQYSQ